LAPEPESKKRNGGRKALQVAGRAGAEGPRINLRSDTNKARGLNYMTRNGNREMNCRIRKTA